MPIIRVLLLSLTALAVTAPASAASDWPVRAVVEAGSASPWPRPPDRLAVTYDCGEASACTLARFMARTRACALYVVKDGVPVLHATADSSDKCRRNNDRRRYGVASITKSITALVFGKVAFDPAFGAPLDLDMPVAAALRPLGLRYRGTATLRDLLQMRSRMAWSEDEQAVIRIAEDAGQDDPRTLVEASERRLARAWFYDWPGFNYSGFDSLLLGQLAEHRLRSPSGPGPGTLAEAVGLFFWTPLGMTHDASWKADFEGHPPGYCCLYTRPEDLARLGQWVLERYHAGASAGAGPMDRWVRDSVETTVRTTGFAPTCSFRKTSQRLRYGFQWWVLSGEGNGFTGRGLNGQFLHILPAQNVVIVQFSDFPDGLGSPEECESYLVHRAIAEHLAGE